MRLFNRTRKYAVVRGTQSRNGIGRMWIELTLPYKRQHPKDLTFTTSWQVCIVGGYVDHFCFLSRKTNIFSEHIENRQPARGFCFCVCAHLAGSCLSS